ncbi:MAG: hypothetical protein IKT68_02540 [Clostridia bacterium]|nr:hypothetical protein [Clostridia bacterium]
MWQCSRCHHIFEQGEAYDSEVVGWLNCCPVCGADSPWPMTRCGVCGQASERLTMGACGECYTDVSRRTRAFLGDMSQSQYDLFLKILEQGG